MSDHRSSLGKTESPSGTADGTSSVDRHDTYRRLREEVRAFGCHPLEELKTTRHVGGLRFEERDLFILEMLFKLGALTTRQVHALGWRGRSESKAVERMRELSQRGLVERRRVFRQSRTSPNIYTLGADGYEILVAYERVQPPKRGRFEPLAPATTKQLQHDLALHAWLISAFRIEAPVGDALSRVWLCARGELKLTPPASAQRVLDDNLAGGQHVVPKEITPDAIVAVTRRFGVQHFIVEYDRQATDRSDYNGEKFERYDALMAGWWTVARFGDSRFRCPPKILFVSDDAAGRDVLMRQASDLVVTRTRVPDMAYNIEWPGRDSMYFLAADDAAHGIDQAKRLGRVAREEREPKPFVPPLGAPLQAPPRDEDFMIRAEQEVLGFF